VFAVKALEKHEARRLRKDQGWSIKRIAAALDVAVSSVSTWVRDIELTPEQEEALRLANPRFNGQRNGGVRRSELARAKRAAYQAAGRALAREGRPLHLAGCMLYWAEGARNKNAVIFTNSDPCMLALFLRFLEECYEVEKHRVAFSCNCFLNNGLALEEIERWWLDRLDLPNASLRRATVNAPSSAGKAGKRTLLYGTARLVVHSTPIAQSIYGAIQEYAGIERPDWLECAPSVAVARR
jgi:transcriptional regulator with XRE-family HTH domain